MKAVILAGGLGTRISEESSVRPKPMVEIGSRPILWHVMKIYSHYGINEFIVCCGYKSEVIKEYFANYYLHRSDVTFDLKNNQVHTHETAVEPWKVSLVYTGYDTMTGGRIKRVRDYVGDETFCVTYGDGVSNINIAQSIEFHRAQKTLATLTAVQPPGRFGAFSLAQETNQVETFSEKPQGDGAWVNGGFFVLEPGIFDYIGDDRTVWEHQPLRDLAHAGQLSAYRHAGFWQPMDTLRDKTVLEQLWNSGQAPWCVWKE
ncbi:MAG: glucose-1-phosphate cytidylyltransferase [Burkholderiales bacterium]|nr:glucose-1-phosphate cytidylyltransferase [Pseudomonadota bacterium]